MTTNKRGVSALLVQHQLGLSCYETAWMMLHRLRRAMVNAAREPLYGEVEVDETRVGGEQAGLRGSRQLKGRRAALVLVAVGKRGNGSGRVRMRVIPDFKAKTFLPFLTQNVSPGSTTYTDGFKSFEGLPPSRFQAHPSHSTTAIGTAKRCEIGGTSGRPRDWQPPAMADRHLPRCEPGSTPSFIWTSSPFGTIAARHLRPPLKPYSVLELSGNQRSTCAYAAPETWLIRLTTTYSGVLKQPDKQKLALARSSRTFQTVFC